MASTPCFRISGMPCSGLQKRRCGVREVGMAYRIGIDAGSKTIKLVVVDEEGNTVYSVYERHRAAIRETLADVIHNLVWRHGDVVGPVAITGSAGIGLARILGLPFVQEVVATTKAVREQFPDADAFIELGGEDAKVVYLTGRAEQRMNATCAGGTGGFIDNIAFMIGASSEQMSNLAMSATQIYPIASRCAVFAQTDVRPLLNAGARKSDIAASALQAVVKQTLGGLCCGRPVRGKVVFLGGPLEHIPELVRRFRLALDLKPEDGVKPADAHLFTAKGAALAAGEQNADAFSLKVLERRVRSCPNPEDDLGHLPPLFETEADRIEFDRRHAHDKMPRGSIYAYEGDAYLGIDAGSTAVKLALVSSQGELLFSDYRPVEGDCLKAASLMVGNMYQMLPKRYSTKQPYIHIARSCVTGYGESLLKAALKVDSGVVETTAHARAALTFAPDASFVLDIGGQDMKALWLQDGTVTDVLLNEACSSGCGSFLEGSAYSLHTRPYVFGQAALASRSPVDLGTKCTVFMTSRVRHAQKIGAPLGDIAAGIAYSVARNALQRVVGSNRVASMGERIVVQGGAFKSDAVLRAFELECGVEVIRPDTAHLMGAIGCAIIARDEATSLGDGAPASSLLGFDELKSLTYSTSTTTCDGCSNSCRLSVMGFSDGRSFVGGGRCSQAALRAGTETGASLGEHAPNAAAAQQSLLSRYRSAVSDDAMLGGIKVGIMDALLQYEQLPFWHALVSGLGFSAEIPNRQRCEELRTKAAESIPSESVCQAAKLAHERLYALADSDVDAVLMPRYGRRGACIVSCDYASVLDDSAGFALGDDARLVSPTLENQTVADICASRHDADELLDALCSLCPRAVQREAVRQRFDEAMRAALGEQRLFEERVAKATQAALDWVFQDEHRHALVLGGRPYHSDPALLHDIDKVAADLGVAVILPLGLGFGQFAEGAPASLLWPHAARSQALAAQVEACPQLQIVFLESFGCGYDVVNMSLVRDELLDAGKTYTLLKLDDIADLAHVKIRLRTLVESLEPRRASLQDGMLQKDAGDGEAVSLYKSWTETPGLGGGISLSSPMMTERQRSAGLPDSIELQKAARDMLVSRSNQAIGISAVADISGEGKRAAALMADAALASLKPIDPPKELPLPPGVRARGASSEDVLADTGLTSADIGLSRSALPPDLCFVASVLTACCLNYCGSNRFATELRVPRVCRNCLLDSVPVLLCTAIGRGVKIDWTSPVQLRRGGRPADGDYCDPVQSVDPLRVGVLGNALFSFDALANENVIELLEGCGCDVVLPDPELLDDDDICFERQLQLFRKKHVELVIYLQCFACLKSHVQVRGAMRRLDENYPSMPITVIEYDPDSSALNRENRIRLAVEAAFERRPGARRPTEAAKRDYAWLEGNEPGVQSASRLLARGVDPLAGEDSIALAYLLEEGFLSNRKPRSLKELEELLEERCNDAEKLLRRQQREVEILRKALRSLS